MRLLVTRPEPEAQATARDLRARGHEVLLDPLLDVTIDPEAEIPERDYQAILVTSVNGVRGMTGRRGEDLRRLPLFAVGERTAEAARTAGFAHVTVGPGAGRDLARLVADALDPAAGPLLQATTAARATELEDALRAADFEIVTASVYRVEAHEAFLPETIVALRQERLDGVLHFSFRMAAAFVASADTGGLRREAARVTHYCLSNAVAAPLTGLDGARISVAPSPRAEALMSCLGEG